MGYSNRLPPEGINANEENLFRELFLLGGGIVAACVLVVGLLYGAAHFLAPFIPFSWERAMASPFTEAWAIEGDSAAHETEEQRLQGLAERLARVMDLTEDMMLEIHVLDLGRAEGRSINAFATLGGHIVFTPALLDLLRDENAIAMVLAHEIAHVRHRDAIRSLGAGLVVSMAVGLVFGDSGMFTGLAEGSHVLASLSYGRQRESAADAAALEALVKLYGHGGGATDLFGYLDSSGLDAADFPSILRSHPHAKDRIADLRSWMRENGWKGEGARTPWLQDEAQ